MTKEESTIETEHIVLVFLGITITAVVSTLAYLALYRGFNANIASVLVNTVFSSFLIYLYLRMAGTQERQQEIMENQEEIMKAHHKPLMEVGPIDFDGEVHASILNSGNGPLEDIRLSTSLSLSDDSEYRGSSFSSSLTKNVQQGPPGSGAPRLRMGNSLKPSEGKQHFTGYPSFAVSGPDGNQTEGTMEEVLETVLDNTDSISFSYEIYIEAEDLFGEPIRELLLHGIMEDLDSPLPFDVIYGDSAVHAKR